ncbi:MAG: selenocysteinyl-tRNA(Sec) synthase, partial [Planctomycetaceae bacterium]|nr:selenocysteinyl-tRNA(Sec) synthase [Planctomycetaceae bacterium]
ASSELPVKAIDRMIASFGGEFSAQLSEPLAADQGESHESSQTPPKIAHAREMICELTGAADAVVVNGHAAALLLAFGTLARHDRFDVLTTPGDLYETVTGYRMDDILLQAGCESLTVGSLTRATLDDYAAGATDETAFVYCTNGIDGCLAVERRLPELSQLVDFARKRNLPLIYDAEWGTFHATEEYGLKGVPICRDLIKMGVSLLVFSCGGLIGCDFAASWDGCGQHFAPDLMRRCAPAVIAGDKSLIREIRKSFLFPMFVPSRHDVAALETVLALSMTRESAEKELPVWQLLSTDNDNLKLRADRMVRQMAAIPGVTDARVVSSPAILSPLRPQYCIPSQELRVTFAAKTAVEVLAALASHCSEQGRAGIAATVIPGQPNTIALNLRTVFAKYDMPIIDAVVALMADSHSYGS